VVEAEPLPAPVTAEQAALSATVVRAPSLGMHKRDDTAVMQAGAEGHGQRRPGGRSFSVPLSPLPERRSGSIGLAARRSVALRLPRSARSANLRPAPWVRNFLGLPGVTSEPAGRKIDAVRGVEIALGHDQPPTTPRTRWRATVNCERPAGSGSGGPGTTGLIVGPVVGHHRERNWKARLAHLGWLTL